MGVIQNSINQTLGAVAGGVAVAKRMNSTTDESAENLQTADTLIKKANAFEDYEKLKEQYSKDKEELGHWQEGKVDVGNGNYMETKEDLSKDIKMRKKALKVMKEKMKARKLQLEAYKTMLGGKK